MGGAYFLKDDERAVGRRGDHSHLTREKVPGVVWPSNQNDPERIPKITLFSWLPQTRPQGGSRRWRDLVKSDLKAVGIQERGLV